MLSILAYRVLPSYPVRLLGFTLLLAAIANLLPFVSYIVVSLSDSEKLTSLYPEDGFGLAILWLFGARYWPAVLISTTLFSMHLGTPFLTASGVGWMDVLLDMVALGLLQHWQVEPKLDRLNDVTAFTLAIFVAALLSFPIYSFRISLLFNVTRLEALLFGLHYFVSAFFSYLIVTPLLLVWRRGYIGSRLRQWFLLAALLAIIAFGFLLFVVDPDLRERLLFLLLPVIVVAAVAGKVGGASAAAALIAVLMMLLGSNASTTLTNDVLHTLFIAAATLTGYLLAAILAERSKAFAEMDYRASHDSLTGLLNRFEFHKCLDTALHKTDRTSVLLYLDLDQFKLVNDTCGHLAGDKMLQALAETLQSVLPADATLARLGGDEFGCLLPDCEISKAEIICQTFHETIRTFNYKTGDLQFSVDVSIGGTILTPGLDSSPDEVLGRADVACYAAKDEGRNRTSFYAKADTTMNQRLAQLHELSQLRTALSGGLFQLYAQKIVNIRDTSDVQPFYEILLRYSPPNDHLPIAGMLGMAQRFGLATDVDRWVFEQAAGVLKHHAGEGLRLTINAGASSLEAIGFQQFVSELPGRYDFDARHICIEITEAVAVQNLNRAVMTLEVLRRQGFDIALDDFGAGVASFGYLSELPVSVVKLDGRFVQSLDKDPASRVIIESLVRISSFRNITCIAECVEDAGVIPTLHELGVTYVQGFAIHRPAPVATITRIRG